MPQGTSFLLMMLVSVMTAANAIGGAAIEGKVDLTEAEKAASIARSRYQVKAAGTVRPAEPVVAVVYLEGKFPESTENVTVQMGQRGYQFTTGVLPIRVGTTVEFPNFDDDYHNVFSYSKSKRFDLGRYRKDEKPASQKFDKAGLVKLYCEIHEHMRANILVLETPYFTRTDTNGTFKLEGLPAGEFKLKAWVDEKLSYEKQVTLVDGKTVTVSFAGKQGE
ncbi:MAG: carboxypeptidase regulatory-like domain-containing protein [Verrucomicrobiota bacterium]|nr:carboxypeptidase regulatory-like domain-containing protein [Verrucomicrobiota bacterium]